MIPVILVSRLDGAKAFILWTWNPSKWFSSEKDTYINMSSQEGVASALVSMKDKSGIPSDALSAHKYNAIARYTHTPLVPGGSISMNCSMCFSK